VISAEIALSVAFRSSCLALAVGFMEQVSVFARTYGPTGPFSSRVARVFGLTASLDPVLERSLRHVIAAGAAGGIAASIVGPFHVFGAVSLAVVVVCTALTRLRRVVASDGAEQLAILTLFATCVALFPGNQSGVMELAVWFIGGQTILSYVTSGVAKASSPIWRRGEAVSLIMGSESHGEPWMAALLDAHPALARLATRSVVVFECLFPVVLYAPPEVVLVVLALGFVFHLACAISMGLNTFLLAFPGSYFCVAYVAQKTSPFW
jgi:hypothetical protein